MTTEKTGVATVESIEALVRSYYTDMYRDALGLPDWHERVNRRLTEEVNVLETIATVEHWTGEKYGQGKNVLVVGAGTGAEFVAFLKRGCMVMGIEPQPEAVRIGQMKAEVYGIPSSRFIQGVAEKLPFSENSFDLVWCFTVLEHVMDVKESIREMVRVTRPHGRIFIVTPDYRQFFEPHYKITMPMFAPNWFLKLWLKLKGRPLKFLDSLKFINSKVLTNIFQDLPVIAFQVIHSWPVSWKTNPNHHTRIVQWMTRKFGIQRDQYWIIQKLDKGR